MTAQRIIESIEASAGTMPKQEREQLTRAVATLVRLGFLHELPLAAPADTPEAFKAAQERLGLSNADMADLLGCSMPLVEKMRAGNASIRPLVAFTLACLPRRVAMARIAQAQEGRDAKGEQAAD